jgi:hypothetical protein
MLAGPLPVRILHTTQFHEFVAQLVAARTVAEALVEMAKLLVARRGETLRIETVSDAANPDRELFENGGLLPGPHAIPGRTDIRGMARLHVLVCCGS